MFSEVLVLKMLVVFNRKQENELNHNLTVIVIKNNLNHGFTLKKVRVIGVTGAWKISNQIIPVKSPNSVCVWQ